DFAKAWRKTERIVFSKTFEKVEGNASIRREVDPGEIRKLKNQSGNLLLVGGAQLASTFIKNSLVDEFRLYIHPVVIGSGKPMFQIEEKINLKFVEEKIFEGGIVMLRYQLQTQKN
ncbi:MAG: dihydrofolate reductase family protein, partial [Balneolaceae bacterium]|nr:dihydrofolate reductase family protein [Balneolaceae bacterium]